MSHQFPIHKYIKIQKSVFAHFLDEQHLLPSLEDKTEVEVFNNHLANITLWQLEEKVRDIALPAAKVCQIKRSIDYHNEVRNRATAALNQAFLEGFPFLAGDSILPCFSETPASILDRISILSLKAYYSAEEAYNPQKTVEHRVEWEQKNARILQQIDDLIRALHYLFENCRLGKMRVSSFGHFKMYNCPSTNPYLANSTTANN